MRFTLASSGAAAVAIDCDNKTTKDAKQATMEALRLSVDLLVKNGVICLWQNASALRWEIGKLIEELGLIIHPSLIWDKNHAQMGDSSSGVMYSCEFCYVLTRKGEKAMKHSEDDRRQIFVVDRNHYAKRASEYEPQHLLEKPALVNAELLTRFTAPGDLILDAFGCTGSMCVEAHKMDRNWIYSESNPKNFAIAKRRVENMLVETQKKSA